MLFAGSFYPVGIVVREPVRTATAGWTGRSSSRITNPVGAVVIGPITTAPTDALYLVMVTSPAHYAQNSAKYGVSTRGAVKSARSPVHRVPSHALAVVHTVATARCLAPCLAISFLARRDASNTWDAATDAHLSAVSGAQTHDIARCAQIKTLRISWSTT